MSPLEKRRFIALFLTSMLLGGIAAAVSDVLAMRQGIQLATGLFSSGTAANSSSPRISVSWLWGSINLGEVDHPYLWAGIGGFLVGAIAGAALFLLLYGAYRLFRRRSPE